MKREAPVMASRNHPKDLLFWFVQGSSPYWMITMLFLICSLLELFVFPSLHLSEACLFYFSLFAPYRLPYSFIFPVSLVFDVAGEFPLGAHGLLWVFLFSIVKSQSKFFYNKPFFMVWFFYAFCRILLLFLKSLATALFLEKGIVYSLGFMYAVLEVALFPLAAFFFFNLYKRTQ